MAVRRPLYYSNGDLLEMDDNMIDDIIAQVEYLYGSNPTTTFNYYNNNNGPGDWTITNTVVYAGAAKVSPGNNTDDDREDTSAEYPSKTDTPDPSVQYLRWNKFSLDKDSVSALNDNSTKTKFPVYFDGTNIRAMSRNDFRDTFIKPAIQNWVDDPNAKGKFAANYDVSMTGWSKANGGTSWIGHDTRANLSAYGDDYKEAIDQVVTVNDFYIFVNTSGRAQSYVEPLYATSDGDLQEYSRSAFDAILEASARDVAANVSGYTVTYTSTNNNNLPAGYNQSGIVLKDTAYGSGTGANFQAVSDYQTIKNDDNASFADDRYYAQEFPGGSLKTVWQYALGVGLE